MNDMNRRQLLREWVHEQVDARASVNLPELSAEAVEHFMGNQAFIEGLLRESLEPVVYQIAKSVIDKTRVPGDYIELGDEIISKEELGKRADTLGKRFERWMEHSGDQHIHFMQMKAPHLLEAAREREKRGNTELLIAAFERKLASDIGPDKRVEEVYSTAEVAQIFESMKYGRGEVA